MILVVLLVFVLVSNSTILMTFKSSSKASLNFTQACSYANEVRVMRIVIEPMKKFFLPNSIILILNIKVIIHFRNSKKWVLSCYKLTLSTIVIDFIYLTFTFPETIFQVFVIQDSIKRYKNPNSVRGDRVLFLFRNFTSNLSFSFCVAFIFIFALFNQIFRKELISFFRLNHFMSKYFFGG